MKYRCMRYLVFNMNLNVNIERVNAKYESHGQLPICVQP